MSESERIDFISVATPNHTHFAIAKAAVEQDLVNCSGYNVDYAGYDMDNPLTAESLQAVGISRYWEQTAAGTGTGEATISVKEPP